jgi:(2Fe-2S) ferredoxin
MELVKLFREKIKEKGIPFPVRAQRAGCFDLCAFGPAVVVYPEGVFYGHVTPADVDEIIESHLIANQPVERLILTD